MASAAPITCWTLGSPRRIGGYGRPSWLINHQATAPIRQGGCGRSLRRLGGTGALLGRVARRLPPAALADTGELGVTYATGDWPFDGSMRHWLDRTHNSRSAPLPPHPNLSLDRHRIRRSALPPADSGDPPRFNERSGAPRRRGHGRSARSSRPDCRLAVSLAVRERGQCPSRVFAVQHHSDLHRLRPRDDRRPRATCWTASTQGSFLKITTCT